MEDYKLRDLRASHTLGWCMIWRGEFVHFFYFFLKTEKKVSEIETKMFAASVLALKCTLPKTDQLYSTRGLTLFACVPSCSSSFSLNPMLRSHVVNVFMQKMPQHSASRVGPSIFSIPQCESRNDSRDLKWLICALQVACDANSHFFGLQLLTLTHDGGCPPVATIKDHMFIKIDPVRSSGWGSQKTTMCR